MFSAMPYQITSPAPMPVPKQIKALLLDDSNFDRERIRRMSRRTQLPIILDEVGSIQEMEVAVRSEQYDVILLDYMLPTGTGIDALNCVKNDPRNCHAAKIMITGAGQIEVAVQAMQKGCHDYLNKDNLDVQTLRDSMTNAMALSRQHHQDELRSAQQREFLQLGLASALQDKDVQASVAEMLRSELAEHRKVISLGEVRRASEDVDVMLIEMFAQDDDDEFVFH